MTQNLPFRSPRGGDVLIGQIDNTITQSQIRSAAPAYAVILLVPASNFSSEHPQVFEVAWDGEYPIVTEVQGLD